MFSDGARERSSSESLECLSPSSLRSVFSGFGLMEVDEMSVVSVTGEGEG